MALYVRTGSSGGNPATLIPDLGIRIPTGASWTLLTRNGGTVGQFTDSEIDASVDLFSFITTGTLEASSNGIANNIPAGSTRQAILATVTSDNAIDLSDGYLVLPTYNDPTTESPDPVDGSIAYDLNDGYVVVYNTALGNWVRQLQEGDASGTSDHGGLTGLLDDDHPQYYNGSRLEPILDGYTTDSEFATHTGDATVHFTEASIDHGSIAGLGDDDHPQYYNDARIETLLDGYTTDAEFTSHAGDATIHFTEASIDHGSIAGLGDDDHPQYFNTARLDPVIDGYVHSGDAAGGDLSGTYPSPVVAALTETSGPTSLVIGDVEDGYFLKRVGSTLIGAPAEGGSGVTDHGLLTGLLDDDHPQYYNDSRIETLLDGYTTDAEFSSHTGDATIHFTEASIDHGSVAGLSDDDHPQYFNNSRLELVLDGYATDGELSSHTGDATIHFTEASIDHGSIAGLGDDDHTQYYNTARLDSVVDGYITGITVEDEGTPITGTPHNIFDFVGAGVTVTDAGSGEATITIPGGGVADHGGLTGLGDDDHPQYYNDIRIESLLDGYTTDLEFSTHTGDAAIHFTEGSIDHGAIAGLVDDDHPQYFNNTRLESVLDGYTTDAEFASHTGDATIHFTEASIDHGSIAGLGDDDHPQYYNDSRIESLLDGYTTDAEFSAHTGDATIHFTEASINHGSIAGLGNDDHPQYYNDSRIESLLDGYTTDAEFTSHTGDATIHFTEASIDHGSIAGLGDDDHPQYFNTARLDPVIDGYVHSGDTAGGDLSGTYPNPVVSALTETGGPTSLVLNSVPDGYFLRRSGSTIIGVQVSAGGGDVSGPGSSTDNAVVRWDGMNGTLVQNSLAVIDDSGHITNSQGRFNGVRHYNSSATDPVTPTPATGDRYYNTVLEMEMRYDGTRAKWLSVESTTINFGRNGNTAPGSYYKTIDGMSYSDVDGFIAPFNGTVVGIGYTRADTDSATFEITAAGSTIASLASTALKGKTIASNANFVTDAVLGVRTSSGGNTTTSVRGWVKVKWRI